MAYLGDVLFFVPDSSDLVHEHSVEKATINNELIVEMLSGPAHINGFAAAGQEISLLEAAPDKEMIPLEIDEGNEYLQATYRDQGVETLQYEVTVYLLVEETTEINP